MVGLEDWVRITGEKLQDFAAWEAATDEGDI